MYMCASDYYICFTYNKTAIFIQKRSNFLELAKKTNISYNKESYAFRKEEWQWKS